MKRFILMLALMLSLPAIGAPLYSFVLKAPELVFASIRDTQGPAHISIRKDGVLFRTFVNGAAQEFVITWKDIELFKELTSDDETFLYMVNEQNKGR